MSRLSSDRHPSLTSSIASSEEPRLLSSEGRRLSSSSTRSYKLPPLPPSNDSLASGTSIAPPLPPVPPPKDPASPMTPQRKPANRQKSPLSNEAHFSSPASAMPGAYPTSPGATPSSATQSTATAYTEMGSPSPGSKRTSGVRNLLSFKALRRSYDKSSLESENARPPSTGSDSMASSLRPSLNKKKSGSFWRRKGSLGMQHGREGEHEGATLSTGVNGNTVVEGGADRSQLNVQKRKSSAFWRRKSSLGLADAFGGADGGTGVGLNGETNGTVNGAQNGMTNGRHFGDEDVVLRGMDTEKQLPGIAQPLSPPLRSWSPPPQIPELFGGGGELGGEDLFKDIH